ncbi:MAG: Hsp20/alpha crystallin family protein [Clostridiales bacterium]|nr:Hsp20/alpha crystallin family protein [Clostridiales bacterium]
MALVPIRARSALSTSIADFNNFFDNFFADNWQSRKSVIKIDVAEDEKAYTIEAEVPGISKDELSITLEDGLLKISIEKEENVENSEKNYIHKERRYTSTSRSMVLSNAASDGVKAKLDNGVLTVTVPKIEPVSPPINPIEIE